MPERHRPESSGHKPKTGSLRIRALMRTKGTDLVKLAFLSLLPGLVCHSSGYVASTTSDFISNSLVYDVLPVAQRGGNEISLDGSWDLAQATRELSSETVDIADLKWTQVRMPATIQYALFQAKAVENPWYGDNWKRLQWIQENDWYLRRGFQVPPEWRGRHIRLRFDGLDYTGAVWLDGKFLGVHEGMFGGPTFDVSRVVDSGAEHELLVRLIHDKGPPETDSWEIGTSRLMKPAALDGTTYIWATRFRTIGLWRSVRLVNSGPAYMEAPWVRTRRIEAKFASLEAEAMIINTGVPFEGTIQARIVDSAEKVVWHLRAKQWVPNGTSYWAEAIEIRGPKLWWPNGIGSQPLYRLELSLAAATAKQDSISSRFGIRTIELRRNPYASGQPHANPGLPSWLSDRATLSVPQDMKLWKRHDTEWPGPSDNLLEDDALYNSDESARYLFVINGRPMYAKGICWLTSNDLLALTPERESWLIEAARRAKINLFRLNGGNDLFETEQFYNLCDEAGILVWQEFPITWTRESAVPLTTWREQIKQSVLRLRQHPSLALYVGGNEFNPYLDAWAPYLGIGRETIEEYDNRPFRMASPGESDYHAYSTPNGNFENIWIGDPNWYLRYFGDDANFIGEWSLSVFANVSALKRVVPPEELTGGPIGYDVENIIETHPVITDHFPQGKLAIPLIHNKLSWYGDLAKSDIAEYVEYSQIAQADVYGYVFEQWRAEFPYKGGEAAWTYNPPSFSSGWQVIDSFGQPQISYYSIKRADEPIHVMADVHFLTWGPGSMFQASVFAVNDGAKPLTGSHVTARILDRQMLPVDIQQWVLSVPANGIKSNSREIRWRIPAETLDSYFFLELTMTSPDGHRLSRRAYWLRVLRSLANPADLARWQSAAVAEPLTTKGPWLKTQIEQAHTAVAGRVMSSELVGSDLRLTVVVKNTGAKPAYPVRLAVQPDRYSALWSDNYFWLAAGESVHVQGTVRVDMRGMDPMTNPSIALPADLRLSISAWNSQVSNIDGLTAPAAVRTAFMTPTPRRALH